MKNTNYMKNYNMIVINLIIRTGNIIYDTNILEN
jgi:hypothetical protein